MVAAGIPIDCPRCRGPRGDERFCRTCGVFNRFPESGLLVASRYRRLGGYLLESLLMVLTLLIGWLIWLAIVAPRSQTPAKTLLNMYILKEDGTPASASRIWARELLIKTILIGLGGSFVFGLLGLLDALWILWDRDRQTLHDKMASTVVVHAPLGIDHLRNGNGAQPHAPQDMEGRRRRSLTPPDPAARRGTSAYRRTAATDERLRELRTLADQGLIIPDEYQRRRREILDDL